MENSPTPHALKTVALLGSYLPRRCGIATFTADLAEAMAEAAPQVNVRVLAMDDRPEGYRYPPRVWFEINQNRPGEYRLAAEFLNLSHADVLNVQHEFGIYGGAGGGHVLELLRRARMPVVSTLHTVLREPTRSQRRVITELAELSDRLVVMSQQSGQALRERYGVAEAKVVYIPHGIPDVPFVDPAFHKDSFGVEGKKVILTFGLLGPGKGIEYVIEALPSLVQKHPEAVYMLLGATHPHEKELHGESYRLGLERRAEELGVAEQVIFQNRFVELRELVEYLGAADIYVAPYPNADQAVSGTLSYALGTGKAIVATPFWYAEEMLADGRGRLVPFKDPAAIAAAICELLETEVERHAMRKRAYTFTRAAVWPKVAKAYLALFEEVWREQQQRPRPAARKRGFKDREPELVELNLEHLRTMTDATGILQHAKTSVPDRQHGYCVDDNARALTAALMAREYAQGERETDILRLVNTYMGFLNHAFNEAEGRFRNFMSYERHWLEEVGSEDSHGRAMSALGAAVARAPTRGHLALAIMLFQKALPACRRLRSPRAWAYCLIGLHAYLRKFSGDAQVRRMRDVLARRILRIFERSATDDWPWPEKVLSYANARLPQALLLAGQWMFRQDMVDRGLRTLEWLWATQTDEEGYFTPVGCNGWCEQGKKPARFDQQPLEAQCMIDACIEAYHVTRDEKWVERAYRCLGWFLGDNDLHLPLYDYATGGCCDGLHAHGVNENQGAESTLAWLLSLLGLYELRKEMGMPRDASEGHNPEGPGGGQAEVPDHSQVAGPLPGAGE